MKNLLFLLLFLPLLAFTQVPQGVGYQGVATDANGIELVNQSISIRANIISASPTGTIEWQETHTTSTDTFGLFILTIGQGTSTGNGAQTSFADITWGANTHFLKIEMDINGGTNYSHMGTNQMMSVPYALYAENANIDYDSISTLLSNDSTFITTVSGGIGGVCDYKYPLGLHGDPITHDLNNYNDYVVPSGKKLYIMQHFGPAQDARIRIDGIPIKAGGNAYGHQYTLANPIIASSGQTIACFSNTQSVFNGIIVEENNDVQSIIHDLNNYNDYVVPSGKKLYIMQHFGPAQDARIRIDGIPIKAGGNAYGHQYTLANPIIASSGQTIACFSNTQSVFNGYIVDENYFEDCKGGGSSSSTIDSSYIDSLVQFYSSGNGGGCNLKYPEGVDGEPIFGVAPYTVPTGKRLVLLATDNDISINGFTLQQVNYGEVVMLKGGDVLYGPNGPTDFNGILIEPKTEIESIFGVAPYTVPTGKRLVLLATDNDISINGFTLQQVNYGEVVMLKGGDVIYGTNGPTDFNGYLADENFFADCGGLSSSTVDSSYIDSLVQFYSSGSGCDIEHPDGFEMFTAITSEYSTSYPYIVPANKRLLISYASTSLRLNGLSLNIPGGSFIYCNEGDIITSANGSTYNFNGYLVDENYFADCGGGGGSSSSTVDSSYIDSLVQFYSGGNGGGCDFSFPESLNGDAVNILLHQTNGTHSTYTVPTGKRLYINNVYGTLNINNIGTIIAASNSFISGGGPPVLQNPVILNSGESIIHYNNEYTTVSGFLVDEYPNLQAFSALLHQTNGTHSTYTVPTGKRLYINNVYGTLNINTIGTIISTSNSFISGGVPPVLQNPVILNSGESIIYHNNDYTTINGYLVDDNYFANCGSGGSSSSSGGNNNYGNMIVSTFGDTLTLNGQSIVVPGVSYANIVPPFGSVTDIDGNSYQTVNIYGQEWMTENLKVTKFNNGDAIPVALSNYNGGGLNSNYLAPSYYDEGSSNESIFYNGFAIQDSRNICPSGWHVPTKLEWEELFDIFGYYDSNNNLWISSGDDLKDNNYWPNYISYSTNYSYMSVYPTGYLDWLNLLIGNNNYSARIWTSTLTGQTGAYSSSELYWFSLEDASLDAIGGDYDAVGMANCRCIKD